MIKSCQKPWESWHFKHPSCFKQSIREPVTITETRQLLLPWKHSHIGIDTSGKIPRLFLVIEVFTDIARLNTRTHYENNSQIPPTSFEPWRFARTSGIAPGETNQSNGATGNMSLIYGRDTFIEPDGEVVSDGRVPFWYTKVWSDIPGRTCLNLPACLLCRIDRTNH